MSVGALVFGRWDWRRALIRACLVIGVLLMTLAWRLDAAVNTAYSSGWTRRTLGAKACLDCRLPSNGWTVAHGLAGVAAVVLFAVLLRAWRGRVVPEPERVLTQLYWVCASLAVTVAVVASFFRVRADGGEGSTNLRYVLAGDATALLLLVIAALGIAASADRGGRSPLSRLRRFVQRHGVNVVAVVALAIAVAVAQQTSGQAIDSIRGWVVWDSQGVARLVFGLASTLLVALVIYETSVRLSEVQASDRDPPAWFWWLGVGGGLLVLGIVAGLVLPLGYGIAVLGGICVILGVLELVDLGTPPPALPEEVTESGRDPLTAEYLAIVPLMAVSAAALAGAVDSALADGAHLRASSLSVLIPCVVLVLFAILMTREEDPAPLTGPRARRTISWRWGASFVGVGAVTVSLFYAHSEFLTAVLGFVLLAALVGYGWVLFHASDDTVRRYGAWLVLLPVAICTGGFVALAVHLDVFDVAHVLGVFGFVNIALAAWVAALHYVVREGLLHRPPRFLWSLGLHQLPLLTLLVLWWVGAALLFAPRSLHDARVTPREGSAPAPTLSQAFEEWRAAQGPAWSGSARDDPPLPLVVVASHGGGIRAAYWTAAVLDCVVGAEVKGVQRTEIAKRTYEEMCTGSARREEQDARAAAHRVFLASGVSGGAVGLYAYARQLLATGKLDEGWFDNRLSGDFASPTIGWTLFHDLPNEVLGLHPSTGGDCDGLHLGHQCFAQDRAAVLEETFDRSWEDAEPYLRETWDDRSSPDPGVQQRARLVPLLVDNSTVVGGGTRAVTSAVDLASWPQEETNTLPDPNDPDAVDERPLAGNAQVLSALCTDNDMRLSTAALLASRFPYVNPSGRINGACEPNAVNSATSPCASSSADCEMKLVDGGYTENSGLFSVEALLPTLRRVIQRSNHDFAGRRQIALVVIELDNHYRSVVGAPPSASSGTTEALVPILTALGGRTAIETFARANAYRAVPMGCAITISPARHPGLEAPLGWELSQGARQDLKNGLVRDNEKKPREQPIVLLQRLQGWLGVSPTAGLTGCIP